MHLCTFLAYPLVQTLLALPSPFSPCFLLDQPTFCSSNLAAWLCLPCPQLALPSLSFALTLVNYVLPEVTKPFATYVATMVPACLDIPTLLA